MAEIKALSDISVKFNVVLLLSEQEAKALEAICGYGPDEFVKWFYKNLGKTYLKPHEEAMRSLFQTVSSELPKQIVKVEKIRKFIRENR